MRFLRFIGYTTGVIFLLSSELFAGGSDPDAMCIAFHCGGALAGCTMNSNCNKVLTCVKGCNSPDPVAKQRCQIICSESSSPSPQYDNLVSCMVGQGCLPAKKPFVCDRPKNEAALQLLTLADLEGNWRVVRGLSASYDCWSCQRLTFSASTAHVSRYDYEYIVKAPRKTTIGCQVSDLLRPDADEESSLPGRLRVDYTVHGMKGRDDWYVLGYTGDYALIYYCGESAMDSYRGAVVMSRSSSSAMPDDVKELFDKALMEAGLTRPPAMADFCTPDDTLCR